MAEPFKPQLRLVIQASIPIDSTKQGDAEYEDLRIHLLAISPDITLNGQIVKMLEPCCKKPQTKPRDPPGFEHFTPKNPTGAKRP